MQFLPRGPLPWDQGCRNDPPRLPPVLHTELFSEAVACQVHICLSPWTLTWVIHNVWTTLPTLLPRFEWLMPGLRFNAFCSRTSSLTGRHLPAKHSSTSLYFCSSLIQQIFIDTYLNHYVPSIVLDIEDMSVNKKIDKNPWALGVSMLHAHRVRHK